MLSHRLTSPTGRRRVRRTHRSVLVGLAGVALAAAGCGTGRSPDGTAAPAASTAPVPPATVTPATMPRPSTTTAPSASPTTTPAPTAPELPAVRPLRPTGWRDESVAVGGTQMHVHCEGAGESTVVLIAGFESSSDSWSAVAPALAERTRVCSYDRPGLGVSGAPAANQTFAAQVADLHTLLAAVGEPGPYVVVGHSFGGATAIQFADRFGDAVEALVLVDASPIAWPATLCSIADDGTDAATSIRSMCSGWSDPTGNAEHLDVFAAFGELLAPPELGTLPVTVLTAVERELPADIAGAERDRLTEAWDRGQRQWTELSVRSRLVAVPDTGHLIQLDQPAVVIAEIDRLLP